MDIKRFALTVIRGNTQQFNMHVNVSDLQFLTFKYNNKSLCVQSEAFQTPGVLLNHVYA
jgi:hypothetical protein